MPTVSRTASSLPATVNLHLVAHCNMKCGYCYARFEAERRAPRLPTDALRTILADLAAHGVRRVTFAGGEPTLHPHLATLLAEAAARGLVTSVVSNGTRIDDTWLDVHGPHLRWLTLSIDSVVPATTHAIGRRTSLATYAHVDHVSAVCERIHAWNARRPPARRLRLKLNITVTGRNADEDPRAFVLACRPEKVKLFQMLLVAGENDDAAHLVCARDAFERYAARLAPLAVDGIAVVPEDNEAMDGSYAMVDPLGRFYQRVDGAYQRSRPITEVGVMAAWAEVGGFDAARFVERGGDYEPGEVASGNAPYLVAIEGLDGTGKSTAARALAGRLGAVLVVNPPPELAAERREADRLPPAERRTWYLAANRTAAAQAERARAAGRPVVMDRSAASTLAYAAAESCAPVAAWPGGLPRPDVLVYLSVPEVVRAARIAGRGIRETREEGRIAQDAEFRARLGAAYAALGAQVVDASGGPEAIVDALVRLLDQPA